MAHLLDNSTGKKKAVQNTKRNRTLLDERWDLLE